MIMLVTRHSRRACAVPEPRPVSHAHHHCHHATKCFHIELSFCRNFPETGYFPSGDFTQVGGNPPWGISPGVRNSSMIMLVTPWSRRACAVPPALCWGPFRSAMLIVVIMSLFSLCLGDFLKCCSAHCWVEILFCNANTHTNTEDNYMNISFK